eukprot:TRINITY_DN74995_c0_g1_i1.p1 TRINITY_DN74995_c0_g1~~TRINITY_DN74995_c0_g1_i1.p1  ORF type:complete len:390 (+),score=71.04 TRINITY_DN74995_c0_g1_i1:51-1220(+)
MDEFEASLAALTEAGFSVKDAERALKAVSEQAAAAAAGGPARGADHGRRVMRAVELAADKLLSESEALPTSDAATAASSSRPGLRQRKPAPTEADEIEEPGDLLCPVLHTIFRDPVFNSAGNTYDRSALEQFRKSAGGKFLDPLTNEVLPDGCLITNWDMRRRVQSFLEANPGYVPEGWADRSVPPPQTSPTQMAGSSGSDVLLGVLAACFYTGTMLISLSACCWLWGNDPTQLHRRLPRRLVCALLSCAACSFGLRGFLVQILRWPWRRGPRGVCMTRCVVATTECSCFLAPTLAAAEWLCPHLLATPMVRISCLFVLLAGCLRSLRWQDASDLKLAALMATGCNGLVFACLGCVEWRFHQHGTFLNAVSLIAIEVTVACVVAIPWLA